MCSAPRANGTIYLFETLKSLIANLHQDEKPNVVIVVYLGSNDTKWQTKILKTLDETYDTEYESGLLQIVEPADQSIYPDYSKITRYTFNDNKARVIWRTKQNVDFAYLFSYCESISEFYLHLEDDVISASNFYGDIQKFVQKQTAYWFILDFCHLGFIGKLFHSSDLWRLKEYLLLFQTLKPCDVLIEDLIQVMMQPKRITIAQSLFDHIGTKSTLANKTQPVKDGSFKDRRKPNVKNTHPYLSKNFKNMKHSNPLAELTASLNQHEDFSPERAYLKNMTGFFWFKDVEKDKFLEVKLRESVKIKEIHITTGHPKTKIDTINEADVNVSRVGDGKCGPTWETVGQFAKGEFHLTFPEKMSLRCIRVVITKKQDTWVIINEISLVT